MIPDHPRQLLRVIDSHTAGEPTRILVSGGPELPPVSMEQCRELLRTAHDRYRRALIHEPRGSDVIVGGVLLPSQDARCVAGIVFLNDAGYLNMCGHGTIGLAVTLAYLERIQPGCHLLETPVGVVGFEYHGENRVTIENVPSYRYRQDLAVDVEGFGPVTGDIAWGGNWFFLVHDHRQTLEYRDREHLLNFSRRIRRGLERAGITGAHGAPIDHIELCGPPSGDADGKNFVLCPGNAYDRSPCGTGTSAKLACLAADGALTEGAIWRQESIIGTVFEGTYRWQGDSIIPRITGTAYVNADLSIIIDSRDPFAWGFPSSLESTPFQTGV